MRKVYISIALFEKHCREYMLLVTNDQCVVIEYPDPAQNMVLITKSHYESLIKQASGIDIKANNTIGDGLVG